MWTTVIILAIVAVIIGITVFFSKTPSKKEIVYSRTYPIEIYNEFGEIRTSYVEYLIYKDSETGELTFHCEGKFAKAHEAYDDSYDYYLKMVTNSKK